jgi:hypothetical protein
MLPPVSATTTMLPDHPSSAPQPVVRPQLSAANDVAGGGMSTDRLLSGGRLEAMSLSGQLQLAQGASVFAETIGQLIKMPRGENESLAAYAARITEAVKALSPGEKLALQRLLNQVVNGLTLRLLAEVLKNPSGPGAARLALHMEMTQLSDHDLPAEAAVTSYRQTAGPQAVPAGRETPAVARPESVNHGNDNPSLDLAGPDAEGQATQRPVAGGARTELSVRTTSTPTASWMNMGSAQEQTAGPDFAKALASPDAGPESGAASPADKHPLPAPGADPSKAGAATRADAMAAGERSKAGPAASPLSVAHPDPAAAFLSEPASVSGYRPGPEAGSTAGTAADGAPAASASQPKPGTVQAAGSASAPAGQAAAAGNDSVPPMEAGAPWATDRKNAATGLTASGAMDASRPRMIPETDAEPAAEADMGSDVGVAFRPARPATAESILGMTQALVKAFAGRALAEALTPLLSLSPLPEELEPAPAGIQTMSRPDLQLERLQAPNGTATMATTQQVLDEATLATKQPSATAPASQTAAEAADMREQLQLALPLILPRDGMPLPYLTYPPTEQEPRREERKVREIAEVDEDGDGQQHPSGEHRFHDRKEDDDEAQEASAGTAETETESGHGGEDGRANDLYWRMAGWS